MFMLLLLLLCKANGVLDSYRSDKLQVIVCTDLQVQKLWIAKCHLYLVAVRMDVCSETSFANMVHFIETVCPSVHNRVSLLDCPLPSWIENTRAIADLMV